MQIDELLESLCIKYPIEHSTMCDSSTIWIIGSECVFVNCEIYWLMDTVLTSTFVQPLAISFGVWRITAIWEHWNSLGYIWGNIHSWLFSWHKTYPSERQSAPLQFQKYCCLNFYHALGTQVSEKICMLTPAIFSRFLLPSCLSFLVLLYNSLRPPMKLKEVIFSPLSVCVFMSVVNDNSKCSEWTFIKLAL